MVNRTDYNLVPLACLLAVIGVCSRELYVPSLPKIASNLPGSHFFSNSIIAAVILGMGISQLIYGPISDAIGRKKLLIFGILLSALASFVSSLVTNSFYLWLMQILSGMGCGACVVLSRAILKDRLKDGLLTRAITYQSMASTLPPLFAPIFGAILQATFGWRSSFLFFSLITLLTAIVSIIYLPETNNSPQKGLLNIKKILKNYCLVMRNRRFVYYTLLISFSFLPIVIYSLSSSFIYQNEFHLSIKLSAMLYGLTTLGYFLGSFFANRYCQKLTAKALLKLGIYLSILGSLILLASALLKLKLIALIVLPMMGIYAGSGIISPILSRLCLEPFPNLAGISSALIFSIRMLIPAILASFFTWIGLKSLLSMSIYVTFSIFMILFLYLFSKGTIKD